MIWCWYDDGMMMMRWWCDDDAMLIWWWWYDDGMMMWWWFDDTNKMIWWYNEDDLMIRWWCDGGASVEAAIVWMAASPCHTRSPLPPPFSSFSPFLLFSPSFPRFLFLLLFSPSFPPSHTSPFGPLFFFFHFSFFFCYSPFPSFKPPCEEEDYYSKTCNVFWGIYHNRSLGPSEPQLLEGEGLGLEYLYF